MEARESTNIQEVLDQHQNTWKTESVWPALFKDRVGRDYSSLPVPPCSFVVFQEQLAERLLNCWENVDKVTIKYLPCVSELK